MSKNVKIGIVNESGASIYSATKDAQSEYPGVAINNLSAISIARRLQNPAAELVKVDAKTLGIGQYQHDVNAKKLNEALARVTKDTVNAIGVDLNLASYAQLQYVAGLNQKLARAIVDKRNQLGRFTSRKQLLSISGISAKKYEQCAGFLKIEGGEEPLEAYLIHPNDYQVARRILDQVSLEEIGDFKEDGLSKLAETVNCSFETAKYIMDALKFKDVRDKQEVELFVGASDAVLEVGAHINGIIRTVTTFGMFIDTGLHVDGLLHISKIDKTRRVNLAEYKPNQRIEVVVDSIKDKPDGNGKIVGLVSKKYFEQTNKL